MRYNLLEVYGEKLIKYLYLKHKAKLTTWTHGNPIFFTGYEEIGTEYASLKVVYEDNSVYEYIICLNNPKEISQQRVHFRSDINFAKGIAVTVAI